MSKSQEPIVLVTGASSGFGLLACRGFLRHGYTVFATSRNRKRLDEAFVSEREHPSLHQIELDVTDNEGIASARDKVRRLAGRVDVLVNNAGFGMGGFFEDLSEAELREQFETNFFGLTNVTRAFLPLMRHQGRRRIINVSSVAGTMGHPGMSAYVSSKWAVEGFSESLRQELLPMGIEVVLIEPGTFRTDIFDRNRRVAAKTGSAESLYNRQSAAITQFIDQTVANSKADPQKVADVIVKVARIARPRLRYLVGTDAHIGSFAKWLLPWRWFEWIILRKLESLASRIT